MVNKNTPVAIKKRKWLSIFELISAILPIIVSVYQSTDPKDFVEIGLQSTGERGGVKVTTTRPADIG
jgi:hypothetical protein